MKFAVLTINDISKVYKTTAGNVVALKNVSFSIPEGQFISIVGPSGSGKSTLLNMVDPIRFITRI